MHPTVQIVASVRWVTTVGWALGRASPVLWACSPTCRRQQHACHARQGTTSHIPPSQCVGNAMQGPTIPCPPSQCACSAWPAPTPPQLVKHSVSSAPPPRSLLLWDLTRPAVSNNSKGFPRPAGSAKGRISAERPVTRSRVKSRHCRAGAGRQCRRGVGREEQTVAVL